MMSERVARQKIDYMLKTSGWIVQDREEINLGAGLGIAIREFSLSRDSADYVLFLDRCPVGVIEAKKIGHTLSGVAEQSSRYITGLEAKYRSASRRPVFSYESTGIETFFTDRRDPDYSSRHVFSFHRPETLADLLAVPETLRSNLRNIPQLNYDSLWQCQKDAIVNLEKSLANGNQRSLIQMATGSGKTFTAVTFSYRLIKHAKARRILFLVDRANLGRQAKKEFQQYVAPDDGRKFEELYNVQLLSSQTIDPTSRVVISTVQRLYSILRGDKSFDESSEESSGFEDGSSDRIPVDIRYNPSIPIGEFDFIVIDECHRSIYNKWKQVLDYFDAFLIGLTATPSKDTIGFFSNNLVTSYTHKRAVADGVNVGYHVYRIKTKVTEEGSTIEAGHVIERRDRLTREKIYERLDDDYVYESQQLDRDVVSPDQIRTIITEFKDRLPEIFQHRNEIPKTLIFAKDDNHAEDITRITREVFGKGIEFCKKITYRTKGNPENILASFKNSPMPRIAVTVDMVATGTDIRPLECIIFMRDVKSKIYFDQMKGRGTRTIKSSDLKRVTPDARSKDHFVIIDAVGVCEHALSDTHSMNRTSGETFESIMNAVAEGNAKSDQLESLAYRLSRLDRSLDDKSKDKIVQTANGQTIQNMTNQILDGIDIDRHVEQARKEFGTESPTEKQIQQVADKMMSNVCKVFDSKDLRKAILDAGRREAIVIDDKTQDVVTGSGFVFENSAQQTIIDFERFMKENKDELVALQIIYSKPYNIRGLAFKDIQELADCIKTPPYNLTPEKLWQAYQNLDRSKVQDNPKKMLTDMISIVRYALKQDEMLVPFDGIVDSKFEKWIETQEKDGKQFTLEQKEWLVMIKDHIATSLTIDVDDFDNVPFLQKGGLAKMYNLFGDDYVSILDELQEVLIMQ